MAIRYPMLWGWGALLVLLLHPVPSAHAKPAPRAPFTSQELQPLLKTLEQEGHPRAYLERVFSDARLRRVERVVGLNAIIEENDERYKQYLSPFALRLARRFRKRHLGGLWSVERGYGVPPEIVVAVLLVETQFGHARLPFRILDVFTTLAVEAGPAGVERHYAQLKADHPELERAYLEERLARKGDWALQELSALLAISAAHGRDVFEIRGSYAGAFGIPQFLPTSYQQWAVDGNGDSRVDLDNLADAMASIANYLRAHGWTEHAGLEEKMRAVWEYNNSEHYVDAIFAISRKLALPSRKVRPRPKSRVAAAEPAPGSPQDVPPMP